jgi:predicted RecA/RadA family phage recombinase
MFGRSHKNGLSLLEIVLSTSLLAGTFMLFSTIFGVALRGTADAGEMSEAITEANSQLTRLEAMADQNSWSALLSADGTSFDSGGFGVEISVREIPLFSTSNSTEQAFAPSLQDRRLDSVMAQAEVSVEKEGVFTRQVRLLSRGPRKLKDPPIEFRGLPTSDLGRGDSATVTAHLIAEDGTEVSTLFNFYVVPQSGNGSITSSRNGREATFTNVTLGRLGTLLYTGGNCRIKAKGRYFGRDIFSDSSVLGLQP